jgi:hypothetical protein
VSEETRGRDATINAVGAAPPEPGSARWLIAHSLMYTLPDVLTADTRRAVEHLAETLSRHGWLKDPADRVLTPTDQAVPTRDELAEAMQWAWDEFCTDTGCFPDCFEWRGGNGRLWARFDRGNFADYVRTALVDNLRTVRRRAAVGGSVPADPKEQP